MLVEAQLAFLSAALLLGLRFWCKATQHAVRFGFVKIAPQSLQLGDQEKLKRILMIRSVVASVLFYCFHCCRDAEAHALPARQPGQARFPAETALDAILDDLQVCT
jgi:hypothetical protein